MIKINYKREPLGQKKAFDEDAFDREEIELFEEIMEGIYGEEI